MTDTATHHLAQLNIGRTVDSLDSPALKDFVDNLDRINALADESPGFVWRLQTDEGNATDVTVDAADPLLIVNLSVWESTEALFDFVYRSDHVGIMKRRRDFFQKWDGPFMVLWWVPAGHIPTTEEAMEKLACLRKHGPSPKAFTFRTPFTSPGEKGVRVGDDMRPEQYCA
ncbi:MAG: DUF3291 domain-containing protein [Alphaproteobacteria bacterium]